MVDQLESLFGEIRSCTHCSYELPMCPNAEKAGARAAAQYTAYNFSRNLRTCLLSG